MSSIRLTLPAPMTSTSALVQINQVALNKLLEIFAYKNVSGVTGNTINDNVKEIVALKDLHEKRKGKNGLSLPDLMRVHQDNGRDIFLNLLLM